MPSFEWPARRSAVLIGLVAATPLLMFVNAEPAAAGWLSYLSAQAAPAQLSDGAAERDDDKAKEEKASVPATVDGRQLHSVLGIEAFSAAGENMGRVVDVLVDRGGQVRAAIIDFGGFLGVGSRQIAVDWRSLRFEPSGKAGTVAVNLTRDQLRGAPVYKSGEPVVMVGGPSAKP